MVNALIDKILVSEREKMADGTVRQEIKIYYKFIGFVGELHITPTLNPTLPLYLLGANRTILRYARTGDIFNTAHFDAYMWVRHEVA